MEIFQDWALPNLEYNLFQVILLFQHKLGNFFVTNDTNNGNRHINVGIEHIWTHLIGFHGNILRWGTSQIGISLISSDLVCFIIH